MATQDVNNVDNADGWVRRTETIPTGTTPTPTTP